MSSISELIDKRFINEKRITPILNKKILKEYLEVLNRDKFDNKVNRKMAIDFISLLNDEGINIEDEKDYVALLEKEQKERMTDIKDFAFYNIVLEAKETIYNEDSYLVTGNKRHFPIECFIKSPKEMLELITEREKYEKELESNKFAKATAAIMNSDIEDTLEADCERIVNGMKQNVNSSQNKDTIDIGKENGNENEGM